MTCLACQGKGAFVRAGKVVLCPCRPGAGFRAGAPATAPPAGQARPDRQRRPKRRHNGY